MRLPRWAAAPIIGCVAASPWYLKVPEVGYNYHDDNGKVIVAGGSHPLIILLAFLGAAVYLVLMFQRSEVEILGPAKFWRRAVAFAIDFWVGLLILSSITALVPLAAEAARTGHFAWQFQRDYSTPADALQIPLIFAFMGLVLLYFALPLTTGRETPGCYVLAIRVTPPFGDEGKFTFRQAVVRTFTEFRGLSLWIGGRMRQDEQGRNWADQKTGCRVVRVKCK